MDRSHQRGFTLFELMISIMILALLVGLAIPTFKSITANSRTSAATNNLASALAVARSEALHRSMRVSVCASTDGASCSGTTDWTGGWIVFIDNATPDGVVDPAPYDKPLQVFPAAGPTMTATADQPYVQYDARGMNSKAAKVTFTIAAVACSGNHKSQFIVTATGSSQQSYVACP